MYGQISPGDLTTAHAYLEGISNCTQCHDLGNQVSDNKCLACHEEITSLVSQNRGYHASAQVRDRTCVDCHSEHHGRQFDMMRFDQENFDHTLTGYPLQGAHASIDCRDCHQPDNIFEEEIRAREGTFLGLQEACLSCHVDFHRGSISQKCISCHSYEAWRPAEGFDHASTDFPLEGAHSLVDCKSCHPITTRGGEDFQQFSDIPHSDCISCHDDAHNGNLPGNCTQCHTVQSFAQFVGNSFNHNQTDFELKGKHRSVSCFDCHTDSQSAALVFQDHLDIVENNCVACHDDVHNGKFGTDCARCHNEQSFYDLNANAGFNHSITDYPLEGQHVGVDCKSCHEGRLTDPIDFSQCKNCHEDYHRGEFVKAGMNPDCAECHTLMQSFTYTTFGFDEHQETNFPLEGAHLATPCFACHVSEDHWTFRDMGESCVDCHEDIHKGYIAEKYYPEQNCINCHSNVSWKNVNFDHSTTNWALTGAHVTVDCKSCHFEESSNPIGFTQNFAHLDSQCSHCHDNVHGDQFALDGVTDCKRCHVTEHWIPENFDHSITRFPLEGAHAELDCKACHNDETIENGKPKINYRIEHFDCIDCHS